MLGSGCFCGLIVQTYLMKKPPNNSIIKVFQSSLGILQVSADKLSITRMTLWKWMQASPELKEALIQAKEKAVDFAESQLFQNIKEGKEASLIFFLKTQAKHRGYSEAPLINFNIEPQMITNIVIEKRNFEGNGSLRETIELTGKDKDIRGGKQKQ